MTEGRKLRFRNLFFIIFVSYLVVLIIPLVMASTIYLRSERIIQEQIMNSNQAILKQMKDTVDDRLDEIEHLSSQIFIDQNTQKLMNTSGTLDSSSMYQAVSLLKSYQSYKYITPFIDDFFVYFYNIDYILTSSSVCKPELYFRYFIQTDQDYEEWKKENFLSTHSGNSASHTVLNFKSGESMLCFWTSLPSSGGDIPLGNICIMVSEDSFQNLLSSIEKIEGSMAFALNETEEIIFASQSAETISVSDLKGCIESGKLVSSADHTEYVFSYIDSSESELRYVTAIPQDVLQAPIGDMRHFAQIMIYICVSVALMLIVGLTYSNYRPIRNIAHQFDDDAEMAEEAVAKMGAYAYIEHSIRRITSKNEQFQATLDNYQPLFRSNFLLKLVDGTVTDLSVIASALDSYRIQFTPSSDFTVLLFHIEDSSRFVKDNSEKERNYVRLILSNIGEELAEKIGTGCMVETSMQTFCLILNLFPASLDEEEKAVREVAEQVKGEIERYFDIIMTVAIGGIFFGFEGIHQSYQEACRALDYRMIQGISTIIYADDLKQATSTYCYPNEEEFYLMNFVRSGDYNQAEKLLNDLFDENFKIRRLSPSIGKCFFFDVISTAVKLLDVMNVEGESVFQDTNPVEELLVCDTVDQMQKKMLDIFKRLCECVNDHKKSHNRELKEEILTYIEDNYTDVNLSQTMIADHFGISPNYLSNFFHEQTGEKMSAYISRQRVEKAKELLRDTDKNMSTIAYAVGLGSDLSLIRIFKKLVGLTPGQYRSQNRNQLKK